MTKVLVDGDIVAYRAAYFGEGKSDEDTWDKADDVLEFIFENTMFSAEGTNYEVYLTGTGNFRHDIDPEYKANRRGKEKPEYLQSARDYLVEVYGATIIDGQEADDAIAIRATELGPETVIASVDKDFLQVPCKHYNFGRGEWAEVTPHEGLLFFYKQVLTGDTADNVIGLRGIGPVKAGKIMDGAEDENEMFRRCVEAYDGDIERVIKNAQLLWLRREEDQIWQPPEAD